MTINIVRTLRQKLSSYVDPPGSFSGCRLFEFDTENIYVNLRKFDGKGVYLSCDEDGNNIELEDSEGHPCGHIYETLVTELNDLYLRNEIFGVSALWPFAISLANKEIELRYKIGTVFLSSVYLFQYDISLIRNSATTLYGRTLQTTGQYEGVEVTPYQGIILQDLRSGDLNAVSQFEAVLPTNFNIFRKFIEIMQNSPDVATQYNALREIACLKRNGLGIYSYQTTSGYYTTPEYTSTNTPAQNTGSVQLAYQPFNSSTYTYSLEWTTLNALRNINRLSEIDYSTGMFRFDGNIYNLVYMIRVGNKMIPYIPIWYDGFDVETYLAHTLELPSTLTAENYKAFMTEETNRTLNATKAIQFVCNFATGSGVYPGDTPVMTNINTREYTLYRLESYCGEEIKRFVEFVNHMNDIETRIAEYLQDNLDTIKQLFPQREGESESNWIPRITGHRLDSSGNWVITTPITTATSSLYSDDTIYEGNTAEDKTTARYNYWSSVRVRNNNYYNMITGTRPGDYALMLYRWRYTTFNVPWYVNKASSEEAYLINENTDDTSYELDSNALALNFDQVYLYYDGLKEIFDKKIICLPMVQVKQVIDECYQTSSNMNKKVLCFLRDDIAYLKRVYSEWFGSNPDGETCIKSEFNTSSAIYFRKWQTILAINFAYADYTANKTSADTKVSETEFYKLYAICEDTSEVNYRNIYNYYLFYLDDWEWHTRADNLGHAVRLYLKPASSISTYPEKTETVEIGLNDSYVVNSDGTITMNETTYEKLIVFTNVSNTFLSEDIRRTIIPMLDMDWKNGSSEPQVTSFIVPGVLTADSWADKMYWITKEMLGYASNGFLREISEYCASSNPGGWQCQGYETFNQNDIIKYVDCCKVFAQNIKDILDYYEANKTTFQEIIKRVNNESEDAYDARVTLDYNRLKINGVRIDEILFDACNGIYTVEDDQATFYKNADTVEERTALWASIAEALQVFADTAVLNDPRTPEGLISDMKEYIPEENAGSSILYTVSPLSIRVCKAWYWDPYEYSGYISPDVITYKITNN